MSGFTDPALREAYIHPVRNVLLWDGADIAFAIRHGMRAGLQAKWRWAVERATPDLKLDWQGKVP